MWTPTRRYGFSLETNEEWATIIKANVYPYNNDIDWREYQHFFLQGGGDVLMLNDSESEEESWYNLRKRNIIDNVKY